MQRPRTQTCGETRWKAVPSQFAQAVSSLIRKYPISNDPTASASPTAGIANPTSTSGTHQTAGTNPKADHADPRQGASRSAVQNQTSASGQPSSHPLNPLQHQPQARFLFLVGMFGRLRLDELPSVHLDTEQFAHQLRSTYLSRKGLWSNWFSLYGFSHCDFAKVIMSPSTDF